MLGTKTYNEKLINCGSNYKKNDNAFIILVEQKLPSGFDMFIQTRSRATKIYKGTMKPTFEVFLKGFLMVHNKNNPKSF